MEGFSFSELILIVVVAVLVYWQRPEPPRRAG
jgi:hypothetical protein